MTTRRSLIGGITVDATEVDVYDPRDDPGDATCPRLEGQLRWERQTYLQFAALPTGCDPSVGWSANGDYGLYRSSATAEVLRELPSVSTALGDAELFVINYTESGQEVESLPTAVAVITLDRPISVDGIECDALNVYELTSDGEPDAIYDVLASLRG